MLMYVWGAYKHMFGEFVYVFLGGGVCLGDLGMCMRGVGVRLVGGGICIGDWCIWPSFRFVCGQGWDLWRCMAVAGGKPILSP